MFFFKQKSAYEMRISDWSSDVCSSDLRKDVVLEPLPQPFPVLRAQVGHVEHLDHDARQFLAQLPPAGVLVVHQLRHAGADRGELLGGRSEERRDGKECVSTGSSRWSPYHEKKH